LLALSPFAPILAATEEAGSTLSGRILDATGQPVSGARVLAYHLSSEEVFDSGATDPKGAYDITGLPYGYFDVAVETPQGLYVADQVVNVAPSGKVTLTLNLYPYTEARADDGRSFPGTEQEPVGQARVGDQGKGGSFWKSPKGYATMAAGGAALLLLVAGGDDNDGGTTSPSSP
jgi:hypothetical protein